VIEGINFIKHLTDAQYIIGWGSLLLLTLIVFAECSFLVGFFLPGNSLIFFAGIVCHSNPETLGVGLPVLIAFLSIAAMVGYYIGYWFGFKTMGPKCLTSNSKIFLFKKIWVDRSIQYYDDHGGKTLIVGRFLPLIRNFAPVIAGMIQMDYKKYMIYNVIGAVIWVGSLAGIGYFFGSDPWVKNNISYIIMVLIIITIASLFVKTKAVKNA
jgi:membrane-associated protein